MRVVAVTGLKGGVGKTSTAVNLAALSAASGMRTLLWDLDPQGAATFCLDLKPKLRGGGRRLIGGGGLAGSGRGLHHLAEIDLHVGAVERLDAAGQPSQGQAQPDTPVGHRESALGHSLLDLGRRGHAPRRRG